MSNSPEVAYGYMNRAVELIGENQRLQEKITALRQQLAEAEEREVIYLQALRKSERVKVYSTSQNGTGHHCMEICAGCGNIHGHDDNCIIYKALSVPSLMADRGKVDGEIK